MQQDEGKNDEGKQDEDNVVEHDNHGKESDTAVQGMSVWAMSMLKELAADPKKAGINTLLSKIWRGLEYG